MAVPAPGAAIMAVHPGARNGTDHWSIFPLVGFQLAPLRSGTTAADRDSGGLNSHVSRRLVLQQLPGTWRIKIRRWPNIAIFGNVSSGHDPGLHTWHKAARRGVHQQQTGS